jgi:hypothetical protein
VIPKTGIAGWENESGDIWEMSPEALLRFSRGSRRQEYEVPSGDRPETDDSVAFIAPAKEPVILITND